MSTTKVQACMWPLLAALACACEPAMPWERTREHRTSQRTNAPPETEVVDDAIETEPEPANDAPLPPSDAPEAAMPTPAPSRPAPASDPPPAAENPEPPPAPAPPTAPPREPALRLRGDLRIALELPLGIALRVRVSALLESGVLHELAHGELDPAGAFELLLAAELQPGLLLAELLDARGQRLGAVWSVHQPSAGEAPRWPVLDARSWLESEVLLGSLGCAAGAEGRPTPMTILLDVANWIDPTLSVALTHAVQAGASRELAVAALARATAAGARARAEVLAQAGAGPGLMLTQLQRDVLERLALQRSQPRAAHEDPEAEQSELRHAWDASLREAGVLDPALRTRAHVAASLAFGASLRGAFAPSSGLEQALFPALHSAAALEASAGSDNVLELLQAANASAESRSAAAQAAATFRAEVAAATDLTALAQARGKFSEALFGRAQASTGGLLGGVLGGTLGLVGGLLRGVLGTLQQLTTKLDDALSLDLAGFAAAGACGDAEAGTQRDSASRNLSRTLSGFSDEVRDASLSAADPATRETSQTLAKALASAQLLLRQRP